MSFNLQNDHKGKKLRNREHEIKSQGVGSMGGTKQRDMGHMAKSSIAAFGKGVSPKLKKNIGVG